MLDRCPAQWGDDAFARPDEVAGVPVGLMTIDVIDGSPHPPGSSPHTIVVDLVSDVLARSEFQSPGLVTLERDHGMHALRIRREWLRELPADSRRLLFRIHVIRGTMGRGLGRECLEAARDQLRAACSVDHPPRQIGVSFAIGLFLLALPNLGASIVVIAVISQSVRWASPQALSAAVVVLNPLVKGLVYAMSVSLGTILLGPVRGVFRGNLDVSIGPKILVRLLVGNVILAVVIAIAGFVIALYSARLIRSRQTTTR